MKTLSLAAALVLVSATAQAKSLNVHVDEKGGDNVRITVPMSVARAVLSIAGTANIELEDEEVKAEDLRLMWSEIKKSRESEIVRVESKDDANVRIAREKGEVRVSVNEKDGAKVEIRMPEAAIDALLSGTGNQLNLAAAMKEIHESFTGDLVNVVEKDETVRIWVD